METPRNTKKNAVIGEEPLQSKRKWLIEQIIAGKIKMEIEDISLQDLECIQIEVNMV